MNGAPKPAVMTPRGISAGAATVRAIRSQMTRNAPPVSAVTGRQRAMCRSDRQPDHMRHDQPHEADDSGHGNRRADGGGNANDREPLHAFDIYAEMESLRFAEGQRIEAAGEAGGDKQEGAGEGEDHQKS